MAQILNLNPLYSSTRPYPNGLHFSNIPCSRNDTRSWTSLRQQLKCNPKFTCLFSGAGSSREEQARKALEGALGGKKSEFEKWNKEIKKREEAGGGGGGSGGGGWFGWGGRFGWSAGDNFWSEAQQTLLAILGIVLLYLIVAKGDLMLAVILNPLLYVLRGTRNGFSYISSKILSITSSSGPTDLSDQPKKQVYVRASAKESVLRKWGSD